jgi:hypothetical protein
MKVVIRVVMLASAVSLLGARATATAPTQVARADDYERCTRYGSLWSPLLGHCMHPGSR